VAVAEQDCTTLSTDLSSASRVLQAVGPHGSSTLAAHVAQHGALPDLSGNQIIEVIDASGLTGRGGAAFPVARKLRAVAAGRAPAVAVANAAEGEPAAFKDKTLLACNPHLVLDGLTLAARAVGADHAYLYVHDDKRLVDVVRRAVLERRATMIDRPSTEFVVAPDRFISGEESAVVSVIEGRGPLPRAKPPRVFECGVYGRPTLVQNAETLAHIGLIARHGASWFRGLGTATEPGTMLCSVSGAVHRPSVVEAPIGIPIREVFEVAGGLTEPVQAVLFGGYHGGWLRAADVVPLALSNAELRPRGAALGAGVLVALPASVCGLAEAARVMLYLAEESAGQCGPCVHGLPRLAEMFDRVALPHGARRGQRASREIDRAIELLNGRGACNHPDGGVRFAISSLQAFRGELEHHARGRCTASSGREVLPTPY
jgi:NADH:ubiquinone oxidoreductase subunit F (NADH-binding)